MFPKTSGDGAIFVGAAVTDTVGLGSIVGVALGVMINLVGFGVGGRGGYVGQGVGDGSGIMVGQGLRVGQGVGASLGGITTGGGSSRGERLFRISSIVESGLLELSGEMSGL
ncbi:hypothetical protein HZB78_05585 [Candidatus Collierbacteria bacterium]|nr:hypothetical protein [Candidatus Collierbacteria bacterium]